MKTKYVEIIKLQENVSYTLLSFPARNENSDQSECRAHPSTVY